MELELNKSGRCGAHSDDVKGLGSSPGPSPPDVSISFVCGGCFQDQGLTCNEVAMQMQVKFNYCESLVLIKFSLKGNTKCSLLSEPRNQTIGEKKKKDNPKTIPVQIKPDII